MKLSQSTALLNQIVLNSSHGMDHGGPYGYVWICMDMFLHTAHATDVTYGHVPPGIECQERYS